MKNIECDNCDKILGITECITQYLTFCSIECLDKYYKEEEIEKYEI